MGIEDFRLEIDEWGRKECFLPLANRQRLAAVIASMQKRLRRLMSPEQPMAATIDPKTGLRAPRWRCSWCGLSVCRNLILSKRSTSEGSGVLFDSIAARHEVGLLAGYGTGKRNLPS